MGNTTEGDLSELGLPLMYQKRLNRNGITTIKELCEKSERDLYFLRNVGHKCIEAVKEALAARGLSISSPTVAPAPTCICPGRPEMELVADTRRGTIYECATCSRLLYQSKVEPVQTWYRPEITFGDLRLEVSQRHCSACDGLQLHVRVEGGLWRCLACSLVGRGDFSQKSPTGS